MPAGDDQADGRPPVRARRRPPRRWVRVRPAASLDPDRRQRLGTPGRRSTSKRRDCRSGRGGRAVRPHCRGLAHDMPSSIASNSGGDQSVDDKPVARAQHCGLGLAIVAASGIGVPGTVDLFSADRIMDVQDDLPGRSHVGRRTRHPWAATPATPRNGREPPARAKRRRWGSSSPSLAPRSLTEGARPRPRRTRSTVELQRRRRSAASTWSAWMANRRCPPRASCASTGHCPQPGKV